MWFKSVVINHMWLTFVRCPGKCDGKSCRQGNVFLYCIRLECHDGPVCGMEVLVCCCATTLLHCLRWHNQGNSYTRHRWINSLHNNRSAAAVSLHSVMVQLRSWESGWLRYQWLHQNHRGRRCTWRWCCFRCLSSKGWSGSSLEVGLIKLRHCPKQTELHLQWTSGAYVPAGVK